MTDDGHNKDHSMAETLKIICPSCTASLKVDVALRGQTRSCPKCSAFIAIPGASALVVDRSQYLGLRLLSDEEVQELGVNEMSETQIAALNSWGLRMFVLGQHRKASIDEIKYDGRLIILDDGSRWEVDSIDASTAEFWGLFDEVVVIDDKMYNLDGCESFDVVEES